MPLNNVISTAQTEFRLLATIAIVFALTIVSGIGATITVKSTNDAGGTCPGATCTLRQAIATATSGDTINFSLPANSAITLTSAELLVNKNLTIKSPGANLLTVQRSGVGGTPDFRIFRIAGNVNAGISGLTIANGVIFSAGSNGGGILNPAGCTLTITNSTISDNQANNGGGISNSGTLTITNSTVSSNSTGAGGGVYNNGGTLTIVNSTISGNGAGAGGGVQNDSGPVTITNSTISGNTAQVGGGMENRGTVTITNSTICNNSETAKGTGGGILNFSGTVTARNTIIAQNTATTGPDFFGTLTSQGYNLIGNTSSTTITGTTTGNQLNVAPVLGALQNNGGPTFTHALLSGSPAIEGGNSSSLNTDQRGLARPVDSPVINNATGGDGSDIGAYEVQADQLPGCSSINRIVNNNNDSGPDSLRGVIASVCAGSTITFAPNVRGTINLTSGELLLNKTLTINGPGANLLSVQRSAAAPNFRIFNVIPNQVIATISGLTVASGNSPSNGGGFNNTGALTIANSTISGHTTGSSGGAIVSSRTLIIVNSTISGNSATGGFGGGIYSTGTLEITNSTISGNSASEFSVGIGSGGGILNGGGTMAITNSTVAGNSAQFRGGGIMNSSGTLRSRNTILALNTAGTDGPNVFGPLISENFNLIGNNAGTTITPAQFSDQIGTPAAPIDPLLGPLQDNGGPTFTRALLSGSTAIDKGESSGLVSDQRGFTRPVDLPDIANVTDGDGSDIGAFEFSGSVPPVPLVSVVSRKFHGGAGPYEIDLLVGSPAVECRTGGATNDHMVVFKFLNPLTSVGSVIFTGAGTVSGSAIGADAHEYIVSVTGVANAQVVTVTLNNVTDSLGNSSSTVGAALGILLGDTTGNGSVTASDIGQTKAQSGQPVTPSNFRTDVTANNAISASDISLVKAQSGGQLP